MSLNLVEIRYFFVKIKQVFFYLPAKIIRQIKPFKSGIDSSVNDRTTLVRKKLILNINY